MHEQIFSKMLHSYLAISTVSSSFSKSINKSRNHVEKTIESICIDKNFMTEKSVTVTLPTTA